MELMFNNARTFYEVDSDCPTLLFYLLSLQAGSQEDTDAELLHKEFSTELRRILKEEDDTGSPESKKLKLKISHGKVISSSIDKVPVHFKSSWNNIIITGRCH